MRLVLIQGRRTLTATVFEIERRSRRRYTLDCLSTTACDERGALEIVEDQRKAAAAWERIRAAVTRPLTVHADIPLTEEADG